MQQRRFVQQSGSRKPTYAHNVQALWWCYRSYQHTGKQVVSMLTLQAVVNALAVSCWEIVVSLYCSLQQCSVLFLYNQCTVDSFSVRPLCFFWPTNGQGYATQLASNLGFSFQVLTNRKIRRKAWKDFLHVTMAPWCWDMKAIHHMECVLCLVGCLRERGCKTKSKATELSGVWACCWPSIATAGLAM